MLCRLKTLLFLNLLAIKLACATTVMVDVFANVIDVDTTINTINQSFESSGIYTKYKINPLIATHKVHLTMYLTEYDDAQIVNLESAVAQIAATTNKFTIKDTGVSLKASNFLMLDVQDSLELQILADKITASLMCYRDKNAIIPAWAKSDPIKNVLFSAYGSPNVFEGFKPHFSIFVATIPPVDQLTFTNKVNQQIQQLNFTTSTYMLNGLGIGITDNNGQIVKLINNYTFKH